MAIVTLIILAEIGITIYFVAFRSKFEDQIKPKLRETLVYNYEGPNKILTNAPVKPVAISIAYDFIMYNVRKFFSSEILFFSHTDGYHLVEMLWCVQ